MKMYLFLMLHLLLPYYTVCNTICVSSNASDHNIKYQNNNVYFILEDTNISNNSAYQFNYRRNNAFESYSRLLHKFNSLFVPKLVYNYNILLTEFTVPEGTQEISFLFYAHSVGEGCSSSNVEIIMKPYGYPTSNISLPEGFITNEADAVYLTFTPSNTIQQLNIHYPIPGDWFMRLHREWDRSDDDKNQGSCPVYISGDVAINTRYPTTNIVNCYDTVQINLKSTNLNVDYNKCYINTETQQKDLKVSLVPSPGVEFAILSLQSMKLNSANEKPQLQCAVMISGTNSNDVIIKFTPHIEAWHYLNVTYGKKQYYPSLGSIALCKDINYPQTLNIKIQSLLRLSKTSLFGFDYVIESVREEAILLPDSLYTLKFRIHPSKDTGGVLSITTELREDNKAVHVVLCLGRNRIVAPNNDKLCQYNLITVEPDISIGNYIHHNKTKIIHIPYPEIGDWYVTARVYYENSYRSKNINSTQDTEEQGIAFTLNVSSSACSVLNCGPYGSCTVVSSGNSIYSACRCTYGFTGWLCTDDILANIQGVYVILLLTLSNLLFIPSIVFAIRRKYYSEALVYLFTMFFSSFYHACDSADPNYGLCIAQYDLLQFIDHYCGILAFWVTLVAMASLNKVLVSILHIAGAVLIAFGTKLDRFSVILYVVPIAGGLIIVILSWILHCKRRSKLFPGKKYLIFFFPAGIIIALVGLICFAVIQTDSNYYIVHTIWHVTVALSVLFLLPIRKIFFEDEYNDSEMPFNAVLERY